MLTSRTALVPHLPTLLVDEHRRHRTPMLESMEALAVRILEDQPAAIVALSARWDSDGPFLVGAARRHRTLTDYSGFGVEVRYDCPGQPLIARALIAAGQSAGVRVGPAERGIDSGITVPLHFLAPRPALPVVPLSVAHRTAAECRAWGAVIRRTLLARTERILFVVGGLLAFAEHDWSLRREVPEAIEFSEHTLGALGRGAWDELFACDPKLLARARPEAGLRHLEVLRGFLGADVPGQLLSYEQGPGVGAALIEFEVPVAAEAREAGERGHA